ncbi:DnaA N-terminal domain-containing protein [Desulfitobacterium sp.]|uniref:DnaA N-terminal domain-containing protein n=1 Tax=Desulfitobacterium sp. TaxID=49981 RepID=UPI003A522213
MPLSSRMEGQNLMLLSPSEFITDWIKGRYYKLIKTAVKSIDDSIKDIIICDMDKKSTIDFEKDENLKGDYHIC